MIRALITFPLACLLFFGCQKKSDLSEKAIPVSTFEVKPNTIPAVFEFVGVAQSSHLVEVRSRVEGILWKIDYTEGAFVNVGDLLFEIDPRQFINAVEEAKGAVKREEAVLWAAQKAVERYAPLYRERAASLRDLEDAIAQQMAAEASLQSATAKLKEAELNLSYSAIVSPIAGMAGKSIYRQGTLITPSINGLLTTVSVVDPIWVIFSVSDSYLIASRTEIETKTLIPPPDDNFEVTLTLADGSSFPYTGKVTFTSPTLDPNTGTMTVRSVFPNPQRDILPGQFVRAQVRGALRPNAIIVPQTAVQQGQKGMYVFVVDENNRAKMQPVTLGNFQNNFWLVKAGLESGDQVVVSGVNKITQGSLVQVVQKVPFPDDL